MMSDPVKNVEIEDVLSSIRRLVSEENRAEPVRKAPEPAPDGRLVLTPALRVADPPAMPERAKDPASVAEEDDLATAPEETAPALDAESAPWSDPGATLYAAAELSGADAPDSQDEDGDTALAPDMDELSDDADDEGADDAPDEARDAVADATPEEPLDDAWQDADAAEHMAEEAWTASDEADQAVDDAAETDTDDAELPEWQAEEIDQPAAEQDTRPLTERIAELEQRISETNEEWEPDGTGTDDNAGTEVETMQWQDHVDDDDADSDTPEEDEVAQAAHDTFPRAVDPGRYMDPEEISDEGDESFDADDIGVLSSDDTFLDEESLRELVADIVRQELQGALGERITRNVRKLVRREIHRALTAQELE